MAPNMRTKRPANADSAGKLHISFDEEKRKAHLNGFTQRKQERRRYGLAMGELKRKRQLYEERKERRDTKKEKDAEQGLVQSPESRAAVDEIVYGARPQAPETQTFDNNLTRDMFGADVVVTTTHDSLGHGDLDEEEEEDRYRKRQRGGADAAAAGGSARPEGHDQAQRFAYSFNAAKAKIDATTLTTKRQRKAQRNKAQMHLDNKQTVGSKSTSKQHAPNKHSRGKGAAGGGSKANNKAAAQQLAVKAVKTAAFGKKKFRTRNARKK